jgi:glycogen synthase
LAGMAQDFSWGTSARKYLEIYKKLIAESATSFRTNAMPLR